MKTEELQLKSNIWKFYVYKVLIGVFFAVPIIVLFWQDNGLNMTEIMVLQSIFAIIVVILEIPTGYFADIYGRKKSLIISAVTLVTAIVTYSLGSSFSHFLIAEIFWALNVSFSSGAMSAFVYDTLENLGQEENYKKIWGKALFYSMMGMAVSSIVGGFIAKTGFRYTFFATIPFFLLTIPVVLSMKEPRRRKLIIKKGYAKKLFKIIKTSLVENKKLRWIIIYSGVIFAFNQPALWLYQPYFKISGLDIVYFGFVFASFHIVSAFSSKYAHKVEKKLGQKYSLVMLIFLVSGSYFLMSNFIFLFSFSFCFIQQFVRGFKHVVITDYINQLTDSSIRATVLSAENFIGKLLYAMVIPVIGWMVDVYTLVQALWILTFTSLVFGVIILIALRRNEII